MLFGLGSFLPRIEASLLLACIVFILRYLVLILAFVRIKNIQIRRAWRLSSFYICLFLTFGLLAPLWFTSVVNLLTVLSIIGAGSIIVLKEVILNVFAWFYLLLRRPFEPGNRITIGEYMGDVLDIRLMDFAMIEVQSQKSTGQSTGKVLHIPNSFVFTHALANASQEFSFNWNEIQIPLHIQSDWQKAVKIIEAIAAEVLEDILQSDQRILEAEKKYAIRYRELKPSVYLDFYSGSIVLTLRHLVEPRNTRLVTDQIWRRILESFAKEKKISLYGDKLSR